MHKKLVRYDAWHFSEVDPVRLKRWAFALRSQIHKKVLKTNDIYKFYSNTMPFVEAAIRGEITHSLDEDECNFISKNYYHDKSEGVLPLEYDMDFHEAVAGFSVTAEALSLEDFEEVVVNGVTYGWVDQEDEDDATSGIEHP